jgi:hypothetical protein
MPQREWCRRLAVVLGYVAIALVFTWPLPMMLGTHLTGDPSGDTGVYVWNQWVFHHEALVGRTNPFTTGRILSLTPPVDLAQHNYTAFLNLLALPLLPLFGVVTTFNLVLLLVTVLTALMTYLLARQVTDATRLEAWVAGLAFAWSPVLLARTTAHFSLVAAAALPAFLLCLVRADASRRLRDAALTGLCMAWAAFSDAYYAIFCLIIAVGYFAARAMRLQFNPQASRLPWLWVLDLFIVLVAGLTAGLLGGGGGRIDIFGVVLSIHGLYTPVLLLTMLVLVRVIARMRPILRPSWSLSPASVALVLVGILACAGPLTPVLYSLGQQVREGQFVSPEILWRSSPRGVDLLAFLSPNPMHPLVRLMNGDPQALRPTIFVEYTAALSLVALLIVLAAIIVAKFRPRPAWVLLPAGFALLALGPFIQVMGYNTHVPGPWALLRYVPIVGAARTPTRFAIVVALGLAVLLAGALAAIGRRYPARRQIVGAIAVLLLVAELWPAPRTLYSASIPALYQAIRDDPRPVRVLELPFGVRDGVSSAGNFSARYQFHQTLHGKRLIGGYLSRISPRRLEAMRQNFPMIDVLVRLSAREPLSPEGYAEAVARAPAFVEKAELAWVVIDRDVAPARLEQFAHEAFHLELVARDGSRSLYRTGF